MMAICDSYHQHGLVFRCYSLEHPAECSCGGDASKCDFFPEKREPEPKLEPCPFCGGHELYIEERQYMWNSPNNVFLAVRCTECGCRTKGVKVNGINSDNERKAMAAVEWNRRAEDAPTVDAVPVVHGRWEKEDQSGISIDGYMVCSVCNVMIPKADYNRYCLHRLNFCPHCGADMRGDGNGATKD